MVLGLTPLTDLLMLATTTMGATELSQESSSALENKDEEIVEAAEGQNEDANGNLVIHMFHLRILLNLKMRWILFSSCFISVL